MSSVKSPLTQIPISQTLETNFPQSSPQLCAHCQTPVHLTRPHGTGALIFCCQGCETVHQFLRSNKLDHYYELLSNQDHLPSPQSHPEMKSAQLVCKEEDCWLGDEHYRFFIPNLRCAACIWLLEKALPRLQGVSHAQVNLMNSTIDVHMSRDSFSAVLERLAQLGYAAYSPLPQQKLTTQLIIRRQRMRDVGMSGLLFANVMLLVTATYFGDLWGMDEGLRHFFNVMASLLGAIALIGPGRHFFLNAWSALLEFRLHIDLPIAIALLLGAIATLWFLFRGEGPMYADSISGLVFFLLLGRSVHESLLERARRLSSLYMQLLPKKSHGVQVGDEVQVLPGELIPADGLVVSGVSEVNEASLTGEQSPALKSPHQRVFAGTQNLTGHLTIQVEATQSRTVLGQVEELIQEAKSHKGAIEEAAQKILPGFTLGTILLSLVVGIYGLMRGDAHHALTVTLAALIVSCPCALALATPLTMSLSLYRAAKHGVLLKRSDIWERLAGIDTVVFDKTGTLTSANLHLKSCVYWNKNAPHLKFQTIASWPSSFVQSLSRVASQSLHPVSRALAKSLPQFAWTGGREIPQVQEIPGFGLAALIPTEPGKTLRLGKVEWALDSAFSNDLCSNQARPSNQGKERGPHVAASWLDHCAYFQLTDIPRPGMREQVHALTKHKLKVYVASGDSKEALFDLCSNWHLDPSCLHANLPPQGKLALLADLIKKGHRVLMVGDGFNDAAALARAHVGLAASGGVDISLSHADGILKPNAIANVSGLILFAKKTTRTLYWVIGLSLTYNFLALSAVLMGYVHPLGAALVMPLSSITGFVLAWFRSGESAWKSCTC